MAFPILVRRNVVLTTCLVVVVILFVVVYTQPALDPEPLGSLIPHRPGPWRRPGPGTGPGEPPPPLPTTAARAAATAGAAAPPAPGPGQQGAEGTATSQLHYLVPATHANIQLCYNLVSSTVNRYPAPMLLGWNGTGDLDAASTHLAKLRALQRHLASLPPHDDDDVVLMVDAYDVMHQLPPDVVIERYLDIAAQATVHLARRLGISPDEAQRRNLRQTIFWGPDKLCFPLDPRAPRCWAVPPSTLGPHAFGPSSGSGDVIFADPRWLNSGTVIGPVHDLRRLVDAVMVEVAATRDPGYEFRESDQYYIANVWGRQEYWRSKQAVGEHPVPGGPPDRVAPDPAPQGRDAELHVAVEYESALFQTRAGYDPFLGRLSFNESGPAARVADGDLFGLGGGLAPYSIQMPANVHAALTRLYDAVPEAHQGQPPSSDWIRTVKLGVNLITRHIYGLWHCTGEKQPIEAEYASFWWHPLAESLLRAAVRSSQAGDAAISPRPLGARRWVAKTRYPPGGDAYGGAWTDEAEAGADGGRFVPWSELCAPHEELLFRGERRAGEGAPPPPPP